jgi:predicted transcriptional regulator
MVVQIILTKGKKTIVDDEDEVLRKMSWYAEEKKNGMYAERKEGKRHTSMHKMVLERKINRKLTEKEVTDHVNGNTLDNRRKNLRVATKRQNAIHRKKQKTYGKKEITSNYVGVGYDKNGKRRKRWIARISINGKQRTIGRYRTEKEAANKRDEIAKNEYGDFAILNNVENIELMRNTNIQEEHKGRSMGTNRIPKKHRSKPSIMVEILKRCIDGAGKTDIVYDVHLNFKTVMPYLNELIGKRLLAEKDGMWKTTEEGKKALKMNLSNPLV